jgi:NIMA (never in mitosis gene a)-related kinase
MASIHHQNVISYKEAFLDGHRLCIVMDLAQKGDLAGVIK